MNFRSGDMVVITKKSGANHLSARREPKTFALNHEHAPLFICDIKEGSHALYISEQADAFNTTIRNKGRGPFDFTPVGLYWYFLLWDGRPIWVSSAEAVLERIR